MAELDYERDKRIDESALDVECLAQASLMMDYGEASARASKRLDLAKQELELVKAKLDEDIRTNPEKFGLTKVTEATVANTIVRNDEYIAANTAMIKAKYQANIARAAADAIDTKKTMLELLVKLHGQQYFAGPKVPRDLSEAWFKRQNQKRSNDAVANAFQRKK